MVGQHREKQVDGANPGQALLLHAPKNGDPPRWQEAASCAEAKHHAVPSFFEGFCHCGRDDCDSEAASDKVHRGHWPHPIENFRLVISANCEIVSL